MCGGRSGGKAPARGCVRPGRRAKPGKDVPRGQTVFGFRPPQADRGMRMLAPANLDELLQSLAGNHARNEKFPPFTLAALNRVVEHAPEDMTVVVEAGISLAALQKKLAVGGQLLALDPPAPAATGIGAAINADAS